MSVKELVTAQMPLMEKADKIFGANESPAKKSFIDMSLNQGGLERAVYLLGKKKEFDACQAKFMKLADAGKNAQAANLLGDFVKKTKMQLAIKFAVVNDNDLVPNP